MQTSMRSNHAQDCQGQYSMEIKKCPWTFFSNTGDVSIKEETTVLQTSTGELREHIWTQAIL